MKRLAYFILFMTLLTCIQLPIQAQDAPKDSIELKLRETYTKREVMIPMRDGVKLYTAIYEPKNNDKKHPILMHRSPYSCEPY